MQISVIGFSDTCKSSHSNRFEVWDESKNEGYAVQPIDESARSLWIVQLHRLVDAPSNNTDSGRAGRPQSWASTTSNDSTTSSSRSSNDTSTTTPADAVLDQQ